MQYGLWLLLCEGDWIMHYGLWFNKDGFGMLKHRQKNPSKNNCIRLP